MSLLIATYLWYGGRIVARSGQVGVKLNLKVYIVKPRYKAILIPNIKVTLILGFNLNIL